MFVALATAAHLGFVPAHHMGPASVLPRLRQGAPAMLVDPATTELVANAGLAPQPIGPTLLAQTGVWVGMIGYGTYLHEFCDVPEPEGEKVEGEVDIYRDTALRYMGYANECGEAFRPLVPVEVVYLTYVGAIAYILADTFDKGKKGADKSLVAGAFGASDTFLWQMLASVVFPSFMINRVVLLLVSLQAQDGCPEPLTAGWIPTVVGLGVIPLIITSLDTLAHWALNGSFRQVGDVVLEE